ncbi:cyanophycin synthetase [Allosediminivita pacifica]|uniref:Cyanophycin synthetase n=1 Tax=Allosediminivita pacifica TaxID=1267769 RepID=A0A2T6AC40_9RHOB|nr:cyanophycin synthetase [Allosediminivita pacifica]PTX41388.1 cyanophycin synthetase [Allosediminivita pacifica]GGB23416.1 cyanophycin synthetase [Allosediminivita pacifica]
MRILEHRALRGPNYYSRYQAIYMRLDIEDLEDRPSDKVPGIAEKLEALLPAIYEHRCSVGEAGGFLQRVRNGTYAGHMVEHVAIELQNMVGFSVGYGKTVDSYDKGVYNVVYRYRDEATGIAAGEAAVEIVQTLYDGNDVDLQPHIDQLKEVRDANALGPSTGAIVGAAKARNIPYYNLTEGTSYTQLGHGVKQRRFQATVTDASGIIGHSIADDKDWTKQILGDAGVTVPRGQNCYSWEEAQEAAEWIGWPVVTKPLSGNHGRGVTTDINSMEDLRSGYDAAVERLREAGDGVIVESYIRGEDHRILVIDGKLVAAARRRPAHVTGDGRSTIQQLIDRENEDPRRGVGHENLLTQIHVDEQTHRMLEQAGHTLDTVLPEGELTFLKSTANISTGGTATDLTDEVHPEVKFAMERIGRLVGLDVIGIDLLAETLSKPLEEQSAGVVEVNAGPGFRMHMAPTHGTPRPVGEHIIDMLFPDPTDDGRIPITAITGTNGKTTTTRLISHILRQAGNSVGMGCTGTVEIDNHVILRGDYSGPAAAHAVLREPTVEHAVLETARGGIMRRGLGFDECDVGVLLNIASDHLGERDIHTLDELARCKTVIVDAVKREGGYCVLNADDPLVMDQGTYWARGEIIYFTMDPENPALQDHLSELGMVLTVKHGKIVMLRGKVTVEICDVNDVPISFEGHARFNVQNAMAAAAAAIAHGIEIDDVRAGLTTFHPTPTQMPGRTNYFEADGVKCLIDYGHNVPALEALEPLVRGLATQRRIGVASAPGNRRDEDLAALGAQLSKMCDTLYVFETDARGRATGETAKLIHDGATSAGTSCEVKIVMEETDAVEQAIDEAQRGDFLLLLIDDIEGTTERLKGRSFPHQSDLSRA